jgi:hypothetical protein
MNALLSLILGDKDLPASFKDGVRMSHKLSPESRQMLEDDHFEDMVKEAREREQMEGDE